VTGAGDRQVFRKAFDDAQQGGFQQQNGIHGQKFPGCAAYLAASG
jgi:hypothetical protein